jgi:hypothetical protein
MSPITRLCVLFLVVGIAAPISLHAQSAGLVTKRKPDGLILSQGNLYFTSHDAATASFWRAAQSAVPGDEILLYSEPNAVFGEVVFAQVDGNFFGYFFSQGNGGAKIKRVPLTGGAATELKNVDVDVMTSHRNLTTDGVNLYWQDRTSIRRMPIRGGDDVVIETTTRNERVAGIVLRNGRIIYAIGPTIRFVPISGAVTNPAIRTVTEAASRVTALHAVDEGIFWGEETGDMHVKKTNGIFKLASTPGFEPTSIATGIVARASTRCAPQACSLSIVLGINDITKPIAAGARGIAFAATGDVFWGDASGVHRQKL